MSALTEQVGGDHYKGMAIQPAEFCQRNRIPYCEANAIKYACRHRLKGGADDVKKAIHYLRLLLEIEYGEKPGADWKKDALNHIQKSDVYAPAHQSERTKSSLAAPAHPRTLPESEWIPTPGERTLNSKARAPKLRPGEILVQWTCPRCDWNHKWVWSKHDAAMHGALDGPCHMDCDECRETSPMIGDGKGNFTKA